jgi:DinB family protein
MFQVDTTQLLITTMEQSYNRLRDRLSDLTDAEFFWQPRPKSWTIYEDRPGHWTYHYEIPDPNPAPLTTVGWQLVHIALTKVMYHEWAFGAARLTFPELVVPHTASSAKQVLEEAHQVLRSDLSSRNDSQLDEPRKTNWGEMWPAWRIFTTMADHDAFHGGTIGYLRDLYHWSKT